MMNGAWWLNTAWMHLCRREARAFEKSTREVAKTQAGVLREILRRNQESEFGRRYGFREVHNPEGFQNRVPVSSWEDYQQAVHRIGRGEKNVLTSDPVELFEPTSGSTSGEKLIPCTATLRQQFQRAVSAWIADLFASRPAIRNGTAYWSISPAGVRPRRTAAGIPVGFEDDTAWLGTIERVFMKHLLAVPRSVARFIDLDNFRYITLLQLLRSADLSLVSVWSPTFLTSLMRPLPEWSDRLVRDLRQGSVSLPGAEESVPAELLPVRKPDRRRGDEVASLLRSTASRAGLHEALWPRLALISCWTDAAAATHMSGLRELFPSVEVQPKGLLATEGCVSIPRVAYSASALALRSHFFEFEETSPDSAGAIRLAHELERDRPYNVILTTGGGLYRYQLRDRVRVCGFEHDCPLLQFLGRSDCSSDLVGEKLGESHVRSVLDSSFAAFGIQPRFALIAPVNGSPPRYQLFLETDETFDVNGLVAAIQTGLERNPYYRHALAMKQLGPLGVQRVPAWTSGWAVYERGCVARGQKPGDIKPVALDGRVGWSDEFSRASRVELSK